MKKLDGWKKKRSLLKKGVTAIVLLNMMYMAVLPNVSSLDATVIASAAAAKAEIVGVDGIPAPDLALRSAILIEASTGQVLLSMNPDEKLPPASMTKMMTEYIVAEAVKQGKIKWDDVVPVSENAAKSVGSRIFLAQGDKHTVKDLYIAMAVGSANDATVALAEYVAGSEQNFVQMMNDTAQRMGMKNSYFINSTGLNKDDMPAKYRSNTDRETVMTARDVAILAGYIVRDHPDYTQFTTLQNYKFRPTDKSPMVNWNWMLESNKNITNFKAYAYEGLNGMKTGHTADAGYCFTGTAVRDGMTLISVVMGATSEPERFVETRKVLDYGFNHFKLQQVVAPKAELDDLKTVPVTKGKETDVPVVTQEAVTFVVPKNVANAKISHTVNVTPAAKLIAPLNQGAKVGTATYTYQAAGMSQPQQKTVSLITAANVEEAGWFRMLFRAIGNFFVDLFSNLKNLF